MIVRLKRVLYTIRATAYAARLFRQEQCGRLKKVITRHRLHKKRRVCRQSLGLFANRHMLLLIDRLMNMLDPIQFAAFLHAS